MSSKRKTAYKKGPVIMSIQIVEDDKTLSEGISISLADAAEVFYKEYTIGNAKAGFEKYGSELNLIILDLNLPDGIGYDYLKYVREKSEVPVLILTANDLEIDEVTGLTIGADDFLTKPFSLAVLRARVNALIRRSRITQNQDTSDKKVEAASSNVYEIDDMVFDFDKLTFSKGNEDIFLSVNEQRLLKIFLDNKGLILTRDTLIERLWGDSGEYVEENALSVTVNRLRSKIDSGSKEKHISTVYGQGYKFD
jgi:DNA-binding response OmpR family regulator